MPTIDAMFLPGFMCDAKIWVDVIDKLGTRIRPQTCEFQNERSIAEMAERVVEQAPDVFALIGFSMGGYVAREVYRLCPERVIKLGLVSTSARGRPAADRSSVHQSWGVKNFTAFPQKTVREFVHSSRHGDEHLIERIRSMAEKLGPQVFQNQALVIREDDRHRLHEISCPTLVVVGADDAVCPVAEAQELAARIPNAELVVLPECGHMTPFEKPEQLAAALHRWLAA